MKQIYTLLFMFTCNISYSQDCDKGVARTFIDINNAGVELSMGDRIWDYSSTTYEFPKGSGINAIFSGGVLYSADVELDTMDGVTMVTLADADFFPGPIDPLTVLPYDGNCINWDRFWNVKRADIDAHILDFEDGVIDDPQASIFSWPGSQNAHSMDYNGFSMPNNSDALAPFVDLNFNSIYEPHLGEYPDVKGDQNIWWVMNDRGRAPSLTRFHGYGMEVHMLAYAFESNNINVKNANYYEVEYFYKGKKTLSNFRASLRTDVDLGCPDDDFFGFNEENNLAFFYNEDQEDGNVDSSCSINGSPSIPTHGSNPPLLGIAQIDDLPYQAGATSFTFSNRIDQILGVPTNGDELKSYLNGKWKEDTPLTYGGNGYNPGSTDTMFYAFPDAPNDPNGWSMCTANLPYDDRRTMINTGGYDLMTGDKTKVTYAVFFVEDVELPCPDINPLIDALSDVKSKFSTGVVTSTNDLFDYSLNRLEVYPNPTTGWVNFELENKDESIASIQVFNLQGQLLVNTINPDRKSVDLSALADGIYLLKVIDANHEIYKSKVVKQ